MFHEQQDVVVFQWIEWLRENVASHLGWSEEQWRQRLPSSSSTSSPSSAGTDAPITRSAIPILHGQPVTDRKSKFQAHLARVQTTEEVQQVMSQLLSDKKIAIATHNISAYRIRTSSGTIHANRDDDGEKGAGDKLLYLLEMMDACNIVVVVSRWFGGTMLGPDRFKHITNVAKEIIEEARLESSGHGRSNDGEGGSKEERGKQSPLKMYNRIKWDAAIDADDVVVGLLPKDSSGDQAEQPQLEVPFTQLEEQDTNLNEATSAFWKRVQYFKTVSTGEMLWQRQPRR
ncbi:RWD domain-containing protein [Balamuthia mandrillaris]